MVEFMGITLLLLDEKELNVGEEGLREGFGVSAAVLTRTDHAASHNLKEAWISYQPVMLVLVNVKV
ncbi:hypothetical protein IGI04_002448 [Brassica rapa subsp. trilocularis]|uniref:Uncharacterized protein n=1 Tax=Brassica rapa subsp. trilocularis TaxID=1813537 RepID=A0ABQ7NWE0_BRACM|nr:hypothetical protein IGI04_002448 [Brassica rapa subsp. trilocularis]